MPKPAGHTWNESVCCHFAFVKGLNIRERIPTTRQRCVGWDQNGSKTHSKDCSKMQLCNWCNCRTDCVYNMAILSNLWSFWEATNDCLQDYCNNLFLHPGLCRLSSCWATSPEVSTISVGWPFCYIYISIQWCAVPKCGYRVPNHWVFLQLVGKYHAILPVSQCLEPIWRFPKMRDAPSPEEIQDPWLRTYWYLYNLEPLPV